MGKATKAEQTKHNKPMQATKVMKAMKKTPPMKEMKRTTPVTAMKAVPAAKKGGRGRDDSIQHVLMLRRRLDDFELRQALKDEGYKKSRISQLMKLTSAEPAHDG